MKVELRKPLLSDAKRYFEILNHPDFLYFPVKPATIKEEKDFLRDLKEMIKKKVRFSFAVTANGKHVGATGLKINQRYPYICEAGYFIDRKYWNKGIATEALELIEKFIADKLDITRIEIITAKGNVASQKVAIKSGYKKEGLMKKYLKISDEFHDCFLYAKILK